MEYALKEQVGEKATGQLAIGIPPSWHGVFTSEFAARMVKELPGITLRVYEGVSNVLRDYMLAGLLDLCIVLLHPATAKHRWFANR